MYEKIKKHAICFDVGNTLVKLGPPISSWHDPLDVPKLEKLLDSYSLGHIETESFFKKLKALSRHADGAIPFEEWFVEKRLIAPYPGASKLLSSLVESNFEVLLFSNTNESHWNFIRTLSLAHSHSFVSFLMHKKKPDPEAFKEVESNAHKSNEKIIFFDDSFANVDIANRLGWNGYCVACSNPIDKITKILREKYKIRLR